MVMRHPANGLPWLNVSPTFTRFLEGLPPREGNAILDLLFRHMQKPDSGFRYSWNEGDLLIWDNTGTMHRAEWYDPTSGRLMVRTKLQGEEPFE